MKLNITELELFHELAKVRSIRELARRRNMEPGRVSRLIQKMEKHLGVKLMKRSVAGILLTEEGQEAEQIIKHILNQSSRLERLSSQQNKKKRVINVGSTALLAKKLIAPCLGELSQRETNLSFNLFDSIPDQLMINAIKGAYDIALYTETRSWPQNWHVEKIGEIRWGLYARKEHSLVKKGGIENVKKQSFTYPLYWSHEGWAVGNDFCPLKLSQRIKGTGTATAEMSLELICQSDEIAFLPEILAREKLESKEIVEIKVPEWKAVKRDLFLAAHGERVLKHQLEAFKNQLAEKI